VRAYEFISKGAIIMATKKKAGKKGTKSSLREKKDKPGDKTLIPSAWRFNATTEEAGHSPIIITDGSASIEFADAEYDHEGGGHHTSTGLAMREISANKTHPISPEIQAGDPPGGSICHIFAGFARFTIEVTVRVNGMDKTFRIVGRRSGVFTSPTIDVDVATFEVNGAFPPKFPQTGVRLVNPAANITRLRIFRGNVLVHDCPLASQNGIEYTVSDPHT
jgi:hypothetical protein